MDAALVGQKSGGEGAVDHVLPYAHDELVSGMERLAIMVAMPDMAVQDAAMYQQLVRDLDVATLFLRKLTLVMRTTAIPCTLSVNPETAEVVATVEPVTTRALDGAGLPVPV